MTIEWQTLPDTGAELATMDGLPLVIIVPSTLYADGTRGAGGQLEDVKLEIEAATGWRIETTTIAGVQHPRGWTLVVERAGKLAQPMTYAEHREAPTAYRHDRVSGPPTACVGLDSYSAINQLTEEWRGWPAGTWLIWASHPGMGGFVRRVGLERVAMALVQEVRP